jgi:trehalose 2-sulfotransferase
VPVVEPSPVKRSCIICCLPRSGSWLLAEALNNTTVVGQPEEYFRPDHTKLWQGRWGLAADDPYQLYIDAALDYSTTDNGVFSVKFHWYQMAWFLEQLREMPGADPDASEAELIASKLVNPAYVYLTRRDKARQAISYWRAGRTDTWFVTKEGEGNSDGGPGLPDVGGVGRGSDDDPDFGSIRLLERLLIEHEASWLHYFEANRIRPFTVLYEHFAANYSATVSEIVRWLGTSLPEGFERLDPGLEKQADEHTEAILEQYLEIRDTL